EIFGNFDNLCIADGHHRSASSYELLKEIGTQASEAMNYFMSYLICESKIKVNEYNRLIHDLNGYSTQEFIKIISEKYTVEKVHEFWKPLSKFTFGMSLEGQFYSLSLKEKPSSTDT